MKKDAVNIAVIGTGYVGLVSGACFAEMGHRVICVDNDENKIRMLKKLKMPIYEEGLEDLVKKNVKAKRLFFTTSIKEAMHYGGIRTEAVFIAVGTPPREDGSADLSAVEKVSMDVALNMSDYTLVVEKSTVPVETCHWIEKTISRYNKKNIPFDVCSNPEFLKEGVAINDFLKPDRIVIGVPSKRAEELMKKIYAPLSKYPLLICDVKSAELIKHASNSFLSTKISFINAVANICEKTGASVELVAKGMGLDKRIGPDFLKAGIGFGGFCLHPDEVVIVRCPSGKIRLLPISMLYEEIKTSDGVWEALSFDSSKNQIHFQPITAISQRLYDGNLLRIKTKMGKEVTVTQDHPILILKSSLWEIKPASEITITDWLPVFLSIPSSPKHISIDLIESFKLRPPSFFSMIKVRPRGDKRWTLTPLARKKLLEITQRNQSRVYDITLRGKPMSLKEYIELERCGLLNWSHEDIELYTAKGNTTCVPAIIKITDDFCRLLGYLTAEGCMLEESSERGVRERIIFHFHESEEEFINDVKYILSEMGIRWTTFHVQQHHTMRILISSRIFAYFLREILHCGRDSYTANVPDIVMVCPNSGRKAFLEGAYRGDGSVYYHRHSPAVTYDFGTVSKNMATGIITLAHSIGIVPSYKTAWQNKSTMPAHFLRISGASQIGLLNGVKGVRHKSEILQRLNLLKRKISPTGYKILSSQAGAVRVTSIEKIPYKGPVYSMEVEKWETFATGSGLILHNCFPKDLEAFYWLSKQKGYDFHLLKAVMAINEEQKKWMVNKVTDELWNLEGKTIALLGLAFKPLTDDMRFAPSIDIVRAFLSKGSKIKAYDPAAMPNAKKIMKDIYFAKDAYDCVKDADCICLITEWKEFAELDFSRVLKLVKHPVLIDGRNFYSPEKMRSLGFIYKSVGRP